MSAFDKEIGRSYKESRTITQGNPSSYNLEKS